jgi:hypothetical protein
MSLHRRALDSTPRPIRAATTSSYTCCHQGDIQDAFIAHDSLLVHCAAAAHQLSHVSGT